jgi:hypothetical protein
VGKTAIAEGLAQRVASERVPIVLKSVRLLSLDHVALLAGTTYRGQYEERIRGIVAETTAASDVILFIDELHNLIGRDRDRRGDGRGQHAEAGARARRFPRDRRHDERRVRAVGRRRPWRSSADSRRASAASSAKQRHWRFSRRARSGSSATTTCSSPTRRSAPR